MSVNVSIKVSVNVSIKVSVNVSIKVSVNVSHMVTFALACHKASVHYQIANSTFFTTSALVLKFSAFLLLKLVE